MERVAFLVEETGERLSCMLNPESIVIRRVSGIRSRMQRGGPLLGDGLGDDPILFTGGGRTEVTLDLLFDVTIEDRTRATKDVRHLTGPLWALSENRSGSGGSPRSPLVRLVWGKQWNMPAVVEAVSERFESFTPDGSPRRSWLRMQLLRIDEPPREAPRTPRTFPGELEAKTGGASSAMRAGPLGDRDVAVRPSPGQRLDEIATDHYGDPALWRLIALANGVADPLHLDPNAVVDLPRVLAAELDR